MTVTLSTSEIMMAANVGMRRNAAAIIEQRRPRFPERYPGELWAFHIESACAEISVARTLGLYWNGSINTFHVPDLPNQIEVRWSKLPSLKVRPDDDGVIVVSVTGQCPQYRIAGWCYSNFAKRSEWASSTAPLCYFVPHARLDPIESLLDEKPIHETPTQGVN